MALVDSRTGDLELSLKLYHPRGLQLGYQQSMTEAPSGPLRIISFIENSSVIEKILRHLKLWAPPERPRRPALQQHWNMSGFSCLAGRRPAV